MVYRRFVTRRWLALPVLLAAASAHAQEAPSSVQDLGNYSLPPSRPQPQPTTVPAPVPTLAPAPPIAAPTPTITVPRIRPTPTPSATVPAPRATPKAVEPRTVPTSTPTPQARPTSSPSPSPVSPLPVASFSPIPEPAPAVEAVVPPPVETGWPAWLVPLLAVGAGALAALAFALLRRRRSSGDGLIAEEPVPLPVPEPSPNPRPAVEPAGPQFLDRPVVTPGRAWIGLSVAPRRAGLNAATFAADLSVTIRNDGDAPAKGIRVGIAILGAERDQDATLADHYEDPIDRLLAQPFDLAPGESREIRQLVTVARDDLSGMTIGGRQMMIPVVALRVDYDTPADEGRSGAAFTLGIVRDGAEKLQPFWLDSSGRMFDRVDARPYGPLLAR